MEILAGLVCILIYTCSTPPRIYKIGMVLSCSVAFAKPIEALKKQLLGPRRMYIPACSLPACLPLRLLCSSSSSSCGLD